MKAQLVAREEAKRSVETTIAPAPEAPAAAEEIAAPAEEEPADAKTSAKKGR